MKKLMVLAMMLLGLTQAEASYNVKVINTTNKNVSIRLVLAGCDDQMDQIRAGETKGIPVTGWRGGCLLKGASFSSTHGQWIPVNFASRYSTTFLIFDTDSKGNKGLFVQWRPGIVNAWKQ